MIITDLDRSIIYSTRVLNEYKHKENPITVEYKGDTPLSFTTEKLLNTLKELKESNELIVVNTLRDLEQVNRLEIKGLFDYIIYSNGGHILYNNRLLSEYEEYLTGLNNNKKLINLYNKLIYNLGEYASRVKIIDNTYIALNVTETSIEFDSLIENIINTDNTYQSIKDRNKMLIMSSHINKGTALKWLSKYTGEKINTVIGDSGADISMLKLAKHTIIPEHSDLYKNKLYKSDFTIPAGLDGSIYIKDIIKYCKGG